MRSCLQKEKLNTKVYNAVMLYMIMCNNNTNIMEIKVKVALWKSLKYQLKPLKIEPISLYFQQENYCINPTTCTYNNSLSLHELFSLASDNTLTLCLWSFWSFGCILHPFYKYYCNTSHNSCATIICTMFRFNFPIVTIYRVNCPTGIYNHLFSFDY